jgi:hypothetical protein
MAEYRHSAHAVFDLKYHMIWCTKYRHKILRGRVAERTPDLIRQICQARDVVIIRGAVSPGPHPSATGSSADSGTGETGAVHQRTILETFAVGVSRTEETVLGTAHVGAGLLLRDGGRGGRGDDQSLY